MQTQSSSGDEAPTLAHRAVVSRQLFFSHRRARVLFTLGVIDLSICFIFAILPDNRAGDSEEAQSIFDAQAALAWLSLLVSAGLLTLIFITYSVTSRELTFERQSRISTLVVTKVGQVLVDMALLAYPTVARQFVALTLVFFAICQIAYGLWVVRTARESFTKRDVTAPA